VYKRNRCCWAVAATADVQGPFGSVAEMHDVDEVAPACEVALWDAIDAQPDSDGSEVGGEGEAAENVVEEDGDLKAVAATSSVVDYGAGEYVLGVDGVGVGGVVVEPKVFIWDCRNHVYVQLDEEMKVFGCITGISLLLKRGRKADVFEKG
jgi:hypothetical protein